MEGVRPLAWAQVDRPVQESLAARRKENPAEVAKNANLAGKEERGGIDLPTFCNILKQLCLQLKPFENGLVEAVEAVSRAYRSEQESLRTSNPLRRGTGICRTWSAKSAY